MPQFDLKNIKVARYVASGGTISYTDAQTIGDAMKVELQIRFAEGRLYAESTLAEYMRKCVGGSISIGVKYIPSAAQQLLFGLTTRQRTVTYIPEGSEEDQEVAAVSLVTKASTSPAYVGVAFYAPDMVDGVEKYTCVKISRALFGQPSMSLQTAGENISFDTPTTSGEFLADDSSNRYLMEVATLDDEEAAKAWVDLVLI